MTTSAWPSPSTSWTASAAPSRPPRATKDGQIGVSNSTVWPLEGVEKSSTAPTSSPRVGARALQDLFGAVSVQVAVGHRRPQRRIGAQAEPPPSGSTARPPSPASAAHGERSPRGTGSSSHALDNEQGPSVVPAAGVIPTAHDLRVVPLEPRRAEEKSCGAASREVLRDGQRLSEAGARCANHVVDLVGLGDPPCVRLSIEVEREDGPVAAVLVVFSGLILGRAHEERCAGYPSVDPTSRLSRTPWTPRFHRCPIRGPRPRRSRPG